MTRLGVTRLGVTDLDVTSLVCHGIGCRKIGCHEFGCHEFGCHEFGCHEFGSMDLCERGSASVTFRLYRLSSCYRSRTGGPFVALPKAMDCMPNMCTPFCG